jgi:hypothetical protein
MRKSILGTILAVAMFCGAAIADDGNMGAGGYTGCDGSNPPPTCQCNPPDICNVGGFASGQSPDQSNDAIDYSDVIRQVGEASLAVL